jgi:hypothetical protein
MTYFLQASIGAILWGVANLVYIGSRRRGERGFGRVIAFFAGMPTTWIALFVVPEGRRSMVEPPPDDEDRLLREIRADRELRERWSPPAVGSGRGDQSEQQPGA